MTLNPITALLEPLEKLITEHGSAVIQEKHIALLREQLTILKDQLSILGQKLTKLETENETLKSYNQTLQEQVEHYKLTVQKYQQPHDTLLDKEKIDILLFLNPRHDESMTYHIAQSLNVSEDVALYHLEELRKQKLIREGLPIVRGQKTWVIESMEDLGSNLYS